MTQPSISLWKKTRYCNWLYRVCYCHYINRPSMAAVVIESNDVRLGEAIRIDEHFNSIPLITTRNPFKPRLLLTGTVAKNVDLLPIFYNKFSAPGSGHARQGFIELFANWPSVWSGYLRRVERATGCLYWHPVFTHWFVPLPIMCLRKPFGGNGMTKNMLCLDVVT